MNVREAVFDLLRSRGMTTIFGNPGSTELPMLTGYPEDFRYVLGLQEIVAVGMADGFAQASGRPAHVNLHTAPGMGNGMGAIFNAQANKAPLLVTAGQQSRSLMTLQANLTNRDAIRMTDPLVKWSYEPPRAEDVPHAIARGIHMASLPPTGPVFVSIPMDDWGAEVNEHEVRHQTARLVGGRATACPETIEQLAARIREAKNPVMAAGPEIDGSGAWGVAVEFAERLRLPVWATPAPGAGRLGFPESHPQFMGVLPPAIGPLSQTLEGHDLILVVGSSTFPYYPNIPGALLPDGASLVMITSDPDEAARAPMGDAVVADVLFTLRALLEELGDFTPERVAQPSTGSDPLEGLALKGSDPLSGGDSDPMSASDAAQALADVWPEDGIAVVESPSATLAIRNRLKLSRPGSWYFGAGGGLGFGLAASVGVQLAQPDRPVVCVIGEGSVQYAVQAFWSAVAYDVPVTFLVLRNEEYAILKWFAALENVSGAPGLDLPKLDSASLAAGYGVESRRTDDPEELREALREAIADGKPRLVETRVAPGMALG